MTLDMLNPAQHPRAVADFLLLVAYTAAIFVSLRWHRWIWICYLVGALAYLIVVAIAEPERSPPIPAPSRDVLFQLCSRDEGGIALVGSLPAVPAPPPPVIGMFAQC